MTTTRKCDIAIWTLAIVVLALLVLFYTPSVRSQNEPARVLLLAGRFDAKMERLSLVLDVSEPGVYNLRIERDKYSTRLIVEDVKTRKVVWAGKLDKER